MTKEKYIEMLLADNETETDEVKKELYCAVIDCADIGLSQTPDNFEIDAKIGLPELWAVIEAEGKSSKARCVDPFRAATLIAEKLGTSYVRISKRRVRTLEDFL